MYVAPLTLASCPIRSTATASDQAGKATVSTGAGSNTEAQADPPPEPASAPASSDEAQIAEINEHYRLICEDARRRRVHVINCGRLQLKMRGALLPSKFEK